MKFIKDNINILTKLFRFQTLCVFTYPFNFPFFQRQSNTPQQQQQSKSTPYQSQLYDSWRTEWNAPYYDQYRSGPSGASSSAEAVNHSGGGRSAYMTKGGRRLSYEDDFWYKLMSLINVNVNREQFYVKTTNKSIQCKFETKKNS